MSVRFYDEAVYEKIRRWVKDPKMRILSPSESTRLFQIRADQSNDKPLTLPLIAISRDNDIEILQTTKKSLTYDGEHVSANEDKSLVLNAIPISISYQLDIYTKFFEEADEYLRNFLFKLINYPKVSIEIPYNDSKVQHDSTIQVSQTVSDTSDIPERLISGQFTRMTIKFSVDDAYLFSAPFMDNWKIEDTGDIDIIEQGE